MDKLPISKGSEQERGMEGWMGGWAAVIMPINLETQMRLPQVCVICCYVTNNPQTMAGNSDFLFLIIL